MNYYQQKTYGRSAEINEVYKLFAADRDVSMHGPRRLGKSFLLDRLVDEGPGRGWVAVKVELAGCADTRSVFRELCNGINGRKSLGSKASTLVTQRLAQFLMPRLESGSTWYQPFVALDHETFFERLIAILHNDASHRWALLVDELPIFLKALHDKGPDGITAARNFMNQLSQLRQKYPRVRWMITGSIGIEPLAQAGTYMGVLAKFKSFELLPLTPEHARDYVQDLATLGYLPNRSVITAAEARALVNTVGWRAAYYLDALAQKVSGPPESEPEKAAAAVEAAVLRLLQPAEMATFGPWEEHLRKHYRDAEQAIAFSILNHLSTNTHADLDGLLTTANRPQLTREAIRAVLIRLDAEGFVAADSWDNEDPIFSFRNPLLRRWWGRYKPQHHA